MRNAWFYERQLPPVGETVLVAGVHDDRVAWYQVQIIAAEGGFVFFHTGENITAAEDDPMMFRPVGFGQSFNAEVK